MVDGVLGSQLAGNFACVSTTNAIGNNVKPAIFLFCFTVWRLPVRDKIFIVTPDTSGVGAEDRSDLPKIAHDPDYNPPG
jgi:hypothetical protein